MKIKNVIDVHTEPWGIQVTAVEIKDVILPETCNEPMAKRPRRTRTAGPRSSPPKENFQAAENWGGEDCRGGSPRGPPSSNPPAMREDEKNSTINISRRWYMKTVKGAIEHFSTITKNTNFAPGGWNDVEPEPFNLG